MQISSGCTAQCTNETQVCSDIWRPKTVLGIFWLSRVLTHSMVRTYSLFILHHKYPLSIRWKIADIKTAEQPVTMA